MFPREIFFFLVQNCSFRETIISDNTERGNLKLTGCSEKKEHEMENLSWKERWNTKQNLHFSWSFFLLTCDQAFCLVSVYASVRGGLDPIAIQSNHLLGKTTRHTHGSLACQFNRPLASVGRKNSFWICFLNTGQFQRLCCLAWPFSPVPGRGVWVTLKRAISRARDGHGMKVWKIIMGYPRNFCSEVWLIGLLQQLVTWRAFQEHTD